MVKAIFLFVLSLCFLDLVLCVPIKYLECKEGGSSILKQVDVTPCSRQPCVVKRGTEEKIEVTFVPKENITAANTVIEGRVGALPFFIPFPVDHPDVCEDHGIKCPMIAGQQYTFQAVLPVKKGYPPEKVLVKWAMHDQNDKVVFCWEIAVKIE